MRPLLTDPRPRNPDRVSQGKTLMTESDWNSCTDPKQMLEFVRTTEQATDRKQRLFALASIRRVSHLFVEKGSQAGVEVLERFADGKEHEGERRQAANDARNAYYEAEHAGDEARLCAGIGLYRCLVAGSVAIATTEAHLWALRAAHAVGQAEELLQCQLLRDLFGPMSFGQVGIDPSWLLWNNGIVFRLAQDTYEQRALPSGYLDGTRLAVLSDALEKAGCDNEEILSHLRQRGVVHVRGCWVVDLLLAKA